MAVFETSNQSPMNHAFIFEWNFSLVRGESNPALFTRILVPVDFSEGADEALQYAVHLAAQTGAELVLFHSIGIQTPGPYLLINPMDMLHTNARKQMEKRLILTREAFAGEGLNPDRIKYEIRNGFAVENIVQLTEELEADLVVLGAKGTSPGGARFWGTTATEVVRRADCPVMVIPPTGGPRALKQVILGTDLTPPQPKALDPLIQLLRHFGSKLEVVHVSKPEDQADLRDEWAKYAADFASIASGIEVEYHEYGSDEKHPTEALKSYADFQDADMLVLVTHERGFLDRLFHRSEARNLALNVELPILILHEQG